MGIIKKVAIVLSLALLALSSCGIPTINDYDDYITFTTTNAGTDSFLLNLGAVPSGEINSTSPGLLLCYKITNTTNASPTRSEFRSKYRSSITSAIPVSFKNDYSNESDQNKKEGRVLTRTNNTYGYNQAFYPLTPSGSDYNSITHSTYTYNLNSLLGNSNDHTFTFELLEESPESGTYYVSMEIEGTEVLKLYRYDGSAFVPYSTTDDEDKANDYNYAQHDPTNLYIEVYAVINMIGNFSNIYWSQMYIVAELPIT